MKHIALTLGVLALTASPSLAQSATKHETGDGNGNRQYEIVTDSGSSDIRQDQNNETRQENVGVVNQSAVYSVGQASTFHVDRVSCPTPSVVFNAASSGLGGDYSSGLSVSGGVVIPLGGRTADACYTAMNARAIHYQLQNEVNTANECSALLSAGINLNSEQFPTLGVICQGVTVQELEPLVVVEEVYIQSEPEPEPAPPLSNNPRARW